MSPHYIKNYINNLLALLILKCVYDRIVYIVKTGINVFFKKGFLRGAQFCHGGSKNVTPPYTNALIRPYKSHGYNHILSYMSWPPSLFFLQRSAQKLHDFVS